MKRPALAACVLLLLATSPGRADLIMSNVFWRTPTDVLADNGLGRIVFSPSQFPQTVAGSSGFVATTLQPVYTPPFWSPPVPVPPFPPGPVPGPLPPPAPPPTDPAVFDHAGFKLILFIQDVDSGAVGSLTFKGVINGSFSPQFSHLTVTLTPPDVSTLHLGHHLYHVTTDPSIHLGLPTDPPGSIGADMTVTHNPEPSSLVLAAIGLPCLGLALRRRGFGRRG
jgi:hypothetical protein